MARNKQNKTMNKVVTTVTGRTKQPRPRSSINHMTGNSALVSSRYVESLSATNGSGLFGGVRLVNPPLLAAANDAGGAVLRNYQEYSMDRAVLEYTPGVGTTTAGTIWIGYYDNPEIMDKAENAAYTNAELLALAKQSPISVSGPIWMPLELHAGMSRRRAKYSSDSTPPADRDEFDLTTHGAFLVATEGVPVSTNFGAFSLSYTARGYHLENNSIAGV